MRMLTGILLLCGWSLLASGCGSDSTYPPAVIIKANAGYYDVTMDYTGRTRREMGRLLALQIQRAVPDYQARMDALLQAQITLIGDMKQFFPDPHPYKAISFADALARARAIFRNVPQEYRDEILGMQDVFGYGTDSLGDGKLSANELLVIQLFPDVLRPWGCSASAAFGASSATGKTVLGRNLDWFSGPLKISANLHAVTTMKNGARMTCNVGMLGGLFAGSQFNQSRVFGALLDAENRTLAYPADVSGKRSYGFDLRYALETYTTLQEVADFMKGREYAFNHLVFLADATTAGVVENNIGSAGRGLRTADSVLREGLTWGILNAVATVNDFRLPGNYFAGDDTSNNERWATYRTNYAAALANGGTIDLDRMKGIAGYATHGGDDEMGDLFLAGNDAFHYATNQSIIMRMDTLEMWVHFAPATGTFPATPTYVRVHHPLE